MKARSSQPLTPEEARAHLAPLAEARRILLAVSGGPDSIALMHLSAAVADSIPLPPIVVATVDHGLQPGSCGVAADVMEQARSLGLEARMLAWTGPKPQASLQEAARDARYGLLTHCAQSLGATHLVTAHTLDDQAETILFRMARGSGPAGLAGMRPVVGRGSILHHRPFLDIPKQRLIAACRAGGWSFVDDPANADPRFARARMRKLLPLLAAEGLDAAALATLGRRLTALDAAIGSKAQAALREARREADTARHLYAAARLFEEPTAILLRAFDLILRDLAPSGAPRLNRLERLVEGLEEAYRRGKPARRTLRGALIALRRGPLLEITREAPRRPDMTSGPVLPPWRG